MSSVPGTVTVTEFVRVVEDADRRRRFGTTGVLPEVMIGGKSWYVDVRLDELRRTDNPSVTLTFDAAYDLLDLLN